MQETWVQFLGQEDPLEKETTTHPVFLAGESHGQRSLAGYSPWRLIALATNGREGGNLNTIKTKQKRN